MDLMPNQVCTGHFLEYSCHSDTPILQISQLPYEDTLFFYS